MLAKPGALKHAGGYENSQMVQDGGVYAVRVRISNDATRRDLVAERTRLTGSIPTEIATEMSVQVSVGSPAAKPAAVWDGVRFWSQAPFSLGFVPGSVRIYSDLYPSDGTPLNAARLFSSEGVLVGSEALDGKFPADRGRLSSAVVVFKVRASTKKMPAFEVDGQSRLARGDHPGGRWRDLTEAGPGERVELLVHYKNTGQSDQGNVVLKLALPPTLVSVRGSGWLHNTTNPSGTQISADAAAAEGINFGGYAPGGGAWLRMTVRVDPAIACGTQQAQAAATVETDNGAKKALIPLSLYRDCLFGPSRDATRYPRWYASRQAR